jgi:16S rRNA (uracil1498-N3)-methyltransferase
VGGPGDGIAVRAGAAAQVFVADPARPVLAGGDLHHLTKVLRLRSGEEVVAGDGRGTWCLCRFRGGPVDEGTALEPDGDVRREAPESAPVTVAFAPAKGDRPEWVVQKLTEVGVDRIVVLAADRSVVLWEGERAGKAVARLERVASEAAAQSRRVWLPEILPPQSVSQAGKLAGLALAERGGEAPGPTVHAVAVGPEGGWSPAERALGLETVGLAEHVLRAETASVAAAVLLCAGRSQRRAEGTVGPA